MNVQLNNSVPNLYEDHPGFKILAQMPFIGSFVQFACTQGIDAKLNSTPNLSKVERLQLLEIKKQFLVDGMWRDLYSAALSVSIVAMGLFPLFFTVPGAIISTAYYCLEFGYNAYQWYKAESEASVLMEDPDVLHPGMIYN